MLGADKLAESGIGFVLGADKLVESGIGFLLGADKFGADINQLGKNLGHLCIDSAELFME